MGDLRGWRSCFIILDGFCEVSGQGYFFDNAHGTGIESGVLPGSVYNQQLRVVTHSEVKFTDVSRGSGTKPRVSKSLL